MRYFLLRDAAAMMPFSTPLFHAYAAPFTLLFSPAAAYYFSPPYAAFDACFTLVNIYTAAAMLCCHAAADGEIRHAPLLLPLCCHADASRCCFRHTLPCQPLFAASCRHACLILMLPLSLLSSYATGCTIAAAHAMLIATSCYR